MNRAQRQNLHLLISQFIRYADDCVPKHIHNTHVLLEQCSTEIHNAALRYLLDFALKGVLEGLLNDLAQASGLLDKAMKDFGDESGMPRTDKICAALRLRNKVVAHRMEVLRSGYNQAHWYKQKYASFKKALNVVAAATEDLHAIAVKLSRDPRFERGTPVIATQPILTAGEVRALTGEPLDRRAQT